MTLSTTVDSTYTNRTAGDTQHQQDHDVIHASVNAVNAAYDQAVTDGFSGTKQAWLEAMVKDVGGDTITASGATVVPLTLKGAASQTANLQQWQDSAGTILAYINASGHSQTRVAGFGAASPAAAIQVFTEAQAADNRPLVVRGAASQTANLAEFQNSAGTVLLAINANGQIVTGRSFFTNPIVGASGGFTAQGDGGGDYVLALQNVGTAPTANAGTGAGGGGYLFVQAGALKFRGGSGTVTTIANA